jgi:drug/metabolite transporter (DMT)-like permease
MNKGLSQGMSSTMLFLTAIIWGTGFIASQIALDLHYTPMQVVGGRMGIAAICLNIFFYKRLISMKKEEIIAGSVLGIMMLSAFIFQMFGLKYSTPSVNAFVTASYVVLIPFLKYLKDRTKLDIFSNISAVMTVTGIGLISLTSGFDISFGAFLTFICAVFYALQFIFTEKYTRKYDPINLTIAMINFSGIVSLGICLISAILFHNVPKTTLKGTMSFLYMGILCTFICFLFQNIGQKYTSAVKAAILLSLESVFCAIFSALIFKEEFTGRMLTGCIIIFAAIIISETKLSFIFDRKKENAPKAAEGEA